MRYDCSQHLALMLLLPLLLQLHNPLLLHF
jgi:hypothetical protein